ncbi:MAG: hypothetical protein GWP09_02095 [Nitrospiraceae bacterium]|nr:hypothetical protein [Nitrospiraceae bacterium]
MNYKDDVNNIDFDDSINGLNHGNNEIRETHEINKSSKNNGNNKNNQDEKNYRSNAGERDNFGNSHKHNNSNNSDNSDNPEENYDGFDVFFVKSSRLDDFKRLFQGFSMAYYKLSKRNAEQDDDFLRGSDYKENSFSNLSASDKNRVGKEHVSTLGFVNHDLSDFDDYRGRILRDNKLILENLKLEEENKKMIDEINNGEKGYVMPPNYKNLLSGDIGVSSSLLSGLSDDFNDDDNKKSRFRDNKSKNVDKSKNKSKHKSINKSKVSNVKDRYSSDEDSKKREKYKTLLSEFEKLEEYELKTELLSKDIHERMLLIKDDPKYRKNKKYASELKNLDNLDSKLSKLIKEIETKKKHIFSLMEKYR